MIRWILNRKLYLDDTIVSKLQQGQIVKDNPFLNSYRIRVDFVTPLVRQYICRKLQGKEQIRLHQIPYLQDKKIDFVKIIEQVVMQMNHWSLLVGDTKRNDTTRLVHDSNEEQEFDSAFYTTMEAVLKGARVRQQALVEKIKTVGITKTLKKKKPDLFIEFADKRQRIIVEHCANVNMNPESKDNESLLGHARKTQQYYKNIGAESAYVIHWTNVSIDKSPHKYWFTHTKAPNVKIVHICYDPLFFRFEIHHDIDKMIVIEHEKTLFPNNAKLLHVRIGKDGRNHDIMIHSNTFKELKQAIQQKFPENEMIRNGKFEIGRVEKDELFSVSIDGSVARLEEDSILQIDIM